MDKLLLQLDAVDLAVGIHRQCVQLFVDVGQHILGHQPAHGTRECRGVRFALVNAGNAVAVAVEQAGCGGDAVHAVQRGLDLAKFDAVAHVLDLAVLPRQEIQQTVVLPDGDIARAVQNIAEIRVCWVLDEAFGCLFPVAEVAAGQSAAWLV